MDHCARVGGVEARMGGARRVDSRTGTSKDPSFRVHSLHSQPAHQSQCCRSRRQTGSAPQSPPGPCSSAWLGAGRGEGWQERRSSAVLGTREQRRCRSNKCNSTAAPTVAARAVQLCLPACLHLATWCRCSPPHTTHGPVGPLTRVDGDLLAHGPVGVLQRVRHRDCAGQGRRE